MYPNFKKDRPLLILAPMDDVTDSSFRSIVNLCCPPDISFTEFCNVDGLNSSGKDRLRVKLDHSKTETNLIAQLWGLNPNNFYQTAQEIIRGEYGKFVGVDLNMGCPDKTIVKNGACSALIENRDLALNIIKATQKGLNGKLPLSVKTRLGTSSIDYSWHKFLLEQNLDMLIIHGRTRLEMSKVAAHWGAIKKIRELRDEISPSTLIIGNGDVTSYDQALSLSHKYQLDGVMVGRGIFNDPYLFSPQEIWEQTSPPQKIKLYLRHVQLFNKAWGNNRPVYILNKFCKVYINNFPGSKELREQLMQAKDIIDLQSKLRTILDTLKK
jgi:tRNA-dihydrouridine synthase